MLRQMLVIEKGFRRSLSISLNKSVRNAAEMLEQGVENLDHAVDLERVVLMQAFRTAYYRSGSSFSQRVFTSIEDVKSLHVPEAKGMGEEFWNAFLGFVELNTASRVSQVSNFTKRWIAREVSIGEAAGKSTGEIARQLRKSGKFNKMRAIRIARTEVHMASNFATQKAVESTRLETEKEWVAFIDDRTRDSHVVMNGKRVAMKDDFLVGGARMQYPGDPRGGARNVIHCRCVLLYHVTRNRYKK